MANTRFLSVAALALLAAVATPSFAKNDVQSIEGKWVMDNKNGKSAAEAPGHLAEEIKIDGNTLIIKSKYDQPQNGVYPLAWLGIMTEKLELGMGGEETVNQIGPFRHVSKTTIDGSTVTTTWNATNDPGSVEGQWIRSLSEDGKTMTLQVKGKASDGRVIDNTVVFRRK